MYVNRQTANLLRHPLILTKKYSEQHQNFGHCYGSLKALLWLFEGIVVPLKFMSTACHGPEDHLMAMAVSGGPQAYSDDSCR